MLALDAHPPGHMCPRSTHTDKHQAEQFLLQIPWSQKFGFFFSSQMTFVDSFLKRLLNLNVFGFFLINISSFISATSTPGGDFFPQL